MDDDDVFASLLEECESMLLNSYFLLLLLLHVLFLGSMGRQTFSA